MLKAIKPQIFSVIVAQYIASSEFVLDIKIANASSESGLDANTSLSSSSQQPEAYTDVARTVSCIGDTVFINFSQDNIFVSTAFDFSSLPSVQEISTMPDVHNLLNVKTLENKDRVKIAKALIASILHKKPNRQVLKEDFIQLSQSIIQIFPSEVKETYYIPFKKRHLSKEGKLYDAYNNLRSKLSSTGLIKRRIKTILEKRTSETISLEYGEYPAVAEELKVLQTEGFEWDKVLEVFQKSHILRQKELKNSDLATVDYLNKYKVLLDEKKYKLFEIDFKILYPSSKNIYEWKLYYLKVIAKAEKLKDNSTQEILSLIYKSDEEDSKLALSLMLVAYILPNSRKHSKLEI